jgi:hypothetical protein
MNYFSLLYYYRSFIKKSQGKSLQLMIFERVPAIFDVRSLLR